MSNKWVEIEEILTGLLADLTVAVEVLKDYERNLPVNTPNYDVKRTCIWRLCIYSIIMNCYKFVELNRKYGSEFNKALPEHNKTRGSLQNKITENTAITKLRNHCVAHVNNDPDYLRPVEVQVEITKLFGGENAISFLDWICPENIENTDKEKSLVGVIEMLRDAITAKL